MPATENEFVIGLAKGIRTAHPLAQVYRPHDAVTLGVPDLLAWIPRETGCLALAVEAKQLMNYLKDPYDPGKRTAPLLHHAFSGPQITYLRELARAGVQTWGIVRVSSDAAFRLRADQIPSTGNFTHEELVGIGELVRREEGVWRFWH